MLIRLLYASRARELGPFDVKDILERSRRNNQALGVTGALCGVVLLLLFLLFDSFTGPAGLGWVRVTGYACLNVCE